VVPFSEHDAFGASDYGSTGSSTIAVEASFFFRALEVVALAAVLLSALLIPSGVRSLFGAVGPVTFAVIGYLLTPFGVVASLVWARVAGIKQQADPWFDVIGLRRQLRRLQAATLLSFVIAYPHITTIAQWATVRFGA